MNLKPLPASSQYIRKPTGPIWSGRHHIETNLFLQTWLTLIPSGPVQRFDNISHFIFSFDIYIYVYMCVRVCVIVHILVECLALEAALYAYLIPKRWMCSHWRHFPSFVNTKTNYDHKKKTTQKWGQT